jgi:hypothetical protein
VRDALDTLLRNTTFVTVAFGIATAWALVHVAEGLGTTITTLLADAEVAGGGEGEYSLSYLFRLQGEPLTWVIGDRVLTLTALTRGLIELAAILFVALLVLRRRSPHTR